jgi:hypothetical protein
MFRVRFAHDPLANDRAHVDVDSIERALEIAESDERAGLGPVEISGPDGRLWVGWCPECGRPIRVAWRRVMYGVVVDSLMNDGDADPTEWSHAAWQAACDSLSN